MSIPTGPAIYWLLAGILVLGPLGVFTALGTDANVWQSIASVWM
jgi:hypothetical protein